MKFFALILTPLFAACYVSAHGRLLSCTVKGKTYGLYDSNSPIRVVDSQDPVKLADKAALTCGFNAQPAPNTVDVKTGETMSFEWRPGEPGGKQNWPHDTGPLLVYLTPCKGPCENFDPKDALWFKADELTRKGDPDNEWFQKDLFKGHQAKFMIPKNLAPGRYLVRYEIIGLHLAVNKYGAEFYPACVQINVTGKPGQNGFPQSKDLVKFPGAYKDDDPGILLNPYDVKNYVAPGPRVAPLGPKKASGGLASSSSSKSKPVPSKTVEGDLNMASPSSSEPPPTSRLSPSMVCNIFNRRGSPNYSRPTPTPTDYRRRYFGI